MATGTATKSLKAVVADPASAENTTSATVMERTYWPRLKAILCGATLRSRSPKYTPTATAMVSTPGRARTRPAAHIESVRARYRFSVRCRISRGNCSAIEVASVSTIRPRASLPSHRETSPNRTATPPAAAATMAKTRTRTDVGSPFMLAAAAFPFRDCAVVRPISARLPDQFTAFIDHLADQGSPPAVAHPAVVVPAVAHPAVVQPADVVPAVAVPTVAPPLEVGPGESLPIGAPPTVIGPPQVGPGRSAPLVVGPAEVLQLAIDQAHVLPAQLFPVVAERIDFAGQRVEHAVRVLRGEAVGGRVDEHVERSTALLQRTGAGGGGDPDVGRGLPPSGQDVVGRLPIGQPLARSAHRLQVLERRYLQDVLDHVGRQAGALVEQSGSNTADHRGSL